MKPHEECGICHHRKALKRYLLPKQDTAYRDVYLCVRCDLTAEPPQHLIRGTE